MSNYKDLISFLNSTTVKTILPKDTKVITIKISDSTQEAFTKLAQHKISSAPVVDDNGEVKGILDIRNFVHVILAVKNTDLKLTKLKKSIGETFPDLLDVETVVPNNTLYEVITLLGYFHRVVVVPEKKKGAKYINVLSQGVVLQFIATNIDKLGELGNETIDKLGLVRARTIIRAKENDNVLEVLQMIVANNISAVPVISSQKRIIGNISITDLKHVGQNLQLLKTSAKHFLSNVLQKNLEARVPALTCTTTEVFRNVILKMAASRVHRVYVCNNEHVPVGVISITDIMRLLEEKAK